MKTFLHYLLLILSLLLSSCSKPEHAIATQQQQAASTYFPIQLGEKTLFLQLALHQAERSKGLMYRESLDPDHGMLFLFEDVGPRAFWMRNTRIPLDLAYLDASGTFLELHKLYPYDEVSVASHSQKVVMAIEMNRGWFKRNKVTPGTQLDVSALIAAIQARGIQPAKFPLSVEH